MMRVIHLKNTRFYAISLQTHTEGFLGIFRVFIDI